MKHLSQQMISMEMRRPHIRRLRRRLQRTLSQPGLNPEQRRMYERQLNGLGEPKVYDADDPPPPGARHPGGRPPVKLDVEEATHESLAAVPHTTLYLYALQHDLEVVPGDTKAQVVNKILSNAQGEES